ncbi:velvet factor-domain-containing protein [Fimicolochytrium jonesii]|uniref:velvet factor-domain-containing protein n=1 Tax=Fimicolochytrium jonesii TaxID=1396493 RepID=UPI0022FDEF7A|nr:velvet factor-domain-containing protein [Fimicolochytrium jonesii]KAI8825861.1 velvet factor-domain-containing protein [Fimicolochytrium jonesii]
MQPPVELPAKVEPLEGQPTAVPALTPRRKSTERHITNELIIRQQPNRARMCGFGTKDYRPVDPAPILQLVRRDGDHAVLNYKQATSLVCHAALWSADGTEERSVVLNPGSVAVAKKSDQSQNADPASAHPAPTAPTGYVSALVGSLVSPCHVLTDIDGTRALFFTFPDLSIRTSGQYILKFSLYDMSKDASQAMAFAVSEVISVYPPKTFPGMTESSQLAKCLARQGIKLHIRSDMRRGHHLAPVGPGEVNDPDTEEYLDGDA